MGIVCITFPQDFHNKVIFCGLNKWLKKHTLVFYIDALKCYKPHEE